MASEEEVRWIAPMRSRKSRFHNSRLLVLIPAPYFRRHRSQPTVKAFVDSVSAAATGAIGGAAYVLGTRALTDVVTVSVAVATFVVLSKWKISELWLIAAAAVLGVLVRA